MQGPVPQGMEESGGRYYPVRETHEPRNAEMREVRDEHRGYPRDQREQREQRDIRVDSREY